MSSIKSISRPTAVTQSRDLVPTTVRERLPVPQSKEQGAVEAHAVLPNGQSINVVTNHNVHLPFREWMLRGVVGAFGNLLAFPFRMIGNALNSMVEGVIGILKIAIIMILGPTLIWLGFMLLADMQQEDSVESGAATIVNRAGDVATGVGKGIDGEAGD